MSKNELMKLSKVKDFSNELIRLGYTEESRKSGSHRIFKKPGKPIISIPSHNLHDTLTAGVRRSIVKLILESDYYNKKG
jgi:predicted RNA binding protein YcfA (HicA-like mRNA interferase family)